MALRAAATIEEFLQSIVDVQDEFRLQYRELLTALKHIGRPTVVLTIYDGIPSLEKWERTALSIFNDVIITEASAVGFAVIDLRAICNKESDYSKVSSIEPSSKGGMKIAKKIAEVAERFDFKYLNTVIL